MEETGASQRARRQKASNSRNIPWTSKVAEVVLLFALLAAPWAIGAVDAWASFALDAAIVAAAALSFWNCRGENRVRHLLCLPSLALLALTGLCAIQACPLPKEVIQTIDGRTATLLDEMIPKVVETVKGDSGSPVPNGQYTLSADPEATWHQATRFLMAWLLFQAVMGLRGGHIIYKRFAWLLLINGVLLTLFAIVQALNWNGKIYWFRDAPPRDGWSAGGPFVHHGHLADYLNLALGMGLGLLLGRAEWGHSSWRNGSKLWLLYACGLLMVGVAASQSRGGALAMALSGVLLLIVIRPPIKILLGGIGGALVLGLIFLQALGQEATVERLRTISNHKVHEIQWRMDLWRQAYESWTRHPWLGVGLGAFQVGVAPELDQDFDYYFDHAENEYATILVEGGASSVVIILIGFFGVLMLLRKAANEAISESRRILIFGAFFSLVAFALHNFSDFGVEIPADGFTAAAICGHVCRLGLRNPSRRQPNGSALPNPNPNPEPDDDDENPSYGRDNGNAQSVEELALKQKGLAFLSFMILLGSWIAISATILPHDYRRHKAAALVIDAGLPRPATRKPVTYQVAPNSELKQAEEALVEALTYRPNWYEGHARLALTHLALYFNEASDAMKEYESKQEDRQSKASPIMLRGGLIEQNLINSDLASFEETIPGFDHLQIAAREMLETRRCCPSFAPAHAWLGCLDYLLEHESRPESGKVTEHCKRAFRAAGSDDEIIWMTAELAAQDKDQTFMGDCWRRSLHVRERDWETVAVACFNQLDADTILEKVVVQGRHALWFAKLIDETDEQSKKVREQFLQTAVERIPKDRGLNRAERLFFEGEARALLNQFEEAAQLMKLAIDQEPNNAAWRRDRVVCLLEIGRVEEAKTEASVAMGLTPNDDNAKEARDLVIEHETEAKPPKAETKP